MAAKKSKPKASPSTGKATKTAKKPAAKKTVKKPAKKATAKKATKKAAPAKKAAKKAAPAKKAVKKATKTPAAEKTTAVKSAPEKAPAAEQPVVRKIKSHHTPSFIKKQRQRLYDLHDELVDAMSGMTRDTIRNAPEGSEASGSGQHQGDAGSDAYDRDFALSVLAKEQDALYEIEQALKRIDSGSYGVCEMSFNKIPTARLEAIPFARLTVDCQAQWEKEYGNRRFRPSNEVGFAAGHQFDDEDSASVSLDEDDE